MASTAIRLHCLLSLSLSATDDGAGVVNRRAQDLCESTAPAPQLRVSLNLTGYGEIDFIPTNRNVTVSATAPNLHGKIVTLPVDGAYEVKVQDGRTEIRGTAGGGFVLMRFALRDESLPGHLAQADLAHFTGYVQRALREVNVPAQIGEITGKTPIVEVLCTDLSGHSLKVIPGVPLHVPFEQPDGCRLLIHPECIPAEDGEQRLDVDVEVTRGGQIVPMVILRSA